MSKKKSNLNTIETKRACDLMVGDVIHLTADKTDNKSISHVGVVIDIAEEEKPRGSSFRTQWVRSGCSLQK